MARKIFEDFFGAHPGVYGIEIIVLGGVGAATGTKKEDRFRAILRLIDYLHYHQTFTFLILDNENYAEKLKREARRAKSIHSSQRYVTRPEYIRIWKDSFEFDNFSCKEIATAMSELAKGTATFSTTDVKRCKTASNSGAALEELYRQKSSYDLQKIKLNAILVKQLLSPKSRRAVETRPIIRLLRRAAQLAARNPLPTMHESWKLNQSSKYLGLMRRPARRRNDT